MSHPGRLQLVGRLTYYLGWIALVCGGIVHINIATALFRRMALTQRNLFEVSVVFFLICVASELRALVGAGNEMSGAVKKQTAA
jgi:hypothetical protein